jgi:nitrite reductase/ring-hydroxylating ferredoxin subunit
MTESVDDATLDPSEREFGPSGISLSTYRFPTGWFIVGFASDLAPGQVKRVHYFGEELVLFRTASGRVSVLDAYCLHLGANMGVGGTVEGEHIVCPWHGWQWRGDGTNALIPYSKIGCKQSGTASSWYGTSGTAGRRTGSRRCCPSWRPTSITRCIRTPGW